MTIAWTAIWRSKSLSRASTPVFDHRRGYVGFVETGFAQQFCGFMYTFPDRNVGPGPLQQLTSPAPWLDLSAFDPHLRVWPKSPPLAVDVIAAGWPLPCLRRAYVSPPFGTFSYGKQTGMLIRGIWFPTLPYLPGLLADTAFWGLPVPLGVFTVSALRRARRRRRGQCFGCGHDLSGSGTIRPECGAAA